MAYSEPFGLAEYDEDATDTIGDPLDISAWRLEIAITDGPVEFPGAEVYRFTEDNDGITRDDDTGTFTLVMTAAVADEIEAGKYSFHAALFEGDSATAFDIPFRGTWRHRNSGE